MTPTDPRHGQPRGYYAGCREECCRQAINRYQKETRLRMARGVTRKVPALGAQRRIQALMALGWTSTDIARGAGWPKREYVLRILHGQNGKPCRWLEIKTDARIREVYDRLSMTLAPETPWAIRTRKRAARLKYAPPLAWDDIDTDEKPQGVRGAA